MYKGEGRGVFFFFFFFKFSSLKAGSWILDLRSWISSSASSESEVFAVGDAWCQSRLMLEVDDRGAGRCWGRHIIYWRCSC